MSARDFIAVSGCYLLVAVFWLLLVGLMFVPDRLIPPNWVTQLLVGAEAIALAGVLYLLREKRL